MYITCKCLNVTIRTRGDELKPANIDNFVINPIERRDFFFRERLATITDLEGITKEQSGLVEVRNVGSWIVYYCLNCSVYTHAIHEERGAALVLVNTGIIMASNKLEKLKASPNLSHVFRIVIDHDPLDGNLRQSPNEFSVSQLSRSQQTALARLQQQLEEGVQKESTAIEEKIRAFTDEQYRLLEQFREKADAEHTLLARLICNSEEGGKFLNNTETLSNNSPERLRADATTSLAQSVNAESPDSPDENTCTEMSIEHEDAETKHPAYKSMMERIAGTRTNSYRYLYAGFLYNRVGNTGSYRCAGRRGSFWGCPGRVKEDATGNITVARMHNHHAAHTEGARIAMRAEMMTLARETDITPKEIFNMVCNDPRFSDVAGEMHYESYRSSLCRERAKWRTPIITEKLSGIQVCKPCNEDEPKFATIMM